MSSDSKSREPSPSTSSSRKRPRTEITPEERREARAHRNRIAAQNSRDRKKAHYSLLERRVAELEEENRRLKAGLPVPTPAPTTSQGEQDAKDKENQELRMRIATLEEGLEAVVKAFTTHGVPSALTGAGSGSIAALSSGLAGPTGSTTSPSALTATIPSPSSSHPSPMSPPTTLTPSTDLSSTPSFPVPSINDLFSTPSSSTLSLSSAPTPLPTPTLIISSESGSSEPESTRHLAAGGLELSFDTSAPTPFGHGNDDDNLTFPSLSSTLPDFPTTIDNETMETLLREILNGDTGVVLTKETESLPSVDLLPVAGPGQTQETKTTTAADATPSQVSGGSGPMEEMKTVDMGEDLDLGIMPTTNDTNFDFGNGFGNGTSISNGITATWLDDYTTGLLEELIVSANNSNVHVPQSASWESFEASLNVTSQSGLGVL